MSPTVIASVAEPAAPVVNESCRIWLPAAIDRFDVVMAPPPGVLLVTVTGRAAAAGASSSAMPIDADVPADANTRPAVGRAGVAKPTGEASTSGVRPGCGTPTITVNERTSLPTRSNSV